MSGLRVALIASNRFPIAQPFAGGLEAHVWHLARGLVAAGHQVTLFAGQGSDPALDCSELAVADLRLSEVAARDPSMPAPAFLHDHHAYLALMLDLAESGRERFDVVHNHSLHYLPIAHAPALSVPMLCTLHTPPTPWLESAIEASGAAAVRFAAVSRHTARAWTPIVPDIEVVTNGIDPDRWPLGPGGGPLIWFGRMTPEKGPHLAIDAARRARRSLLLAGPRSDPQYFDAEVAPQLDDNIRYVGHLPHPELAALVGRASVALVTPMWDEPYGLVVAEALSCGTPVVAFARGGIPEIVDADSGRLVAPGDTAAMAEAVRQAESLPRIGVHDRARKRCSVAHMLARYVSIYHRMINSQKAASHDRLLRPPQRQRAPRARGQHLRSTDVAGRGTDIIDRHSAPPISHGDSAPA